MRKEKILEILEILNFPKNEFYILSGSSLVFRGIKDECGDLDLCISEELFEKVKDKLNLTSEIKNAYGFYHISDELELVVDKKENFKCEMYNGYNLENLKTVLEFKKKRNLPKDISDIKRIEKFLQN